VEHAKPASKYKESAGAEKAQEPSEKERKKQLQKPEAAVRVSPEGAEAERGKTKRPAQIIPQPLQKVLSTSTAKVVMLRLASVCCFILGPFICMGVLPLGRTMPGRCYF
jgi:hypothetical protein